MAHQEIELDDLSHVIGTIYDCAVDSQYWPKALESIARLVDGACGLIIMVDTIQLEALFHVDWNLGPEALREYLEKFQKANPTTPGLQRFDENQPTTFPH